MDESLTFPDLLRLIEQRSVAFRAAVAAGPDLESRVPTCPDWTLRDLVRHLGQVHRHWAGVVDAGPATAPPDRPTVDAPPDLDALLAWSAASTQLLLAALRAAGPDRDCWTWWGLSESPQNSGAVARHQLQELAVHTYNAQLTRGVPEPLPDDVALDGVEEFLSTCSTGPTPWPHGDATVDVHTTEGRSWRLSLSTDGARLTRRPTGPALASIRGTAREMVLVLYDRIPIGSLPIDGDRQLFDLLREWNPYE